MIIISYLTHEANCVFFYFPFFVKRTQKYLKTHGNLDNISVMNIDSFPRNERNPRK